MILMPPGNPFTEHYAYSMAEKFRVTQGETHILRLFIAINIYISHSDLAVQQQVSALLSRYAQLLVINRTLAKERCYKSVHYFKPKNWFHYSTHSS